VPDEPVPEKLWVAPAGGRGFAVERDPDGAFRLRAAASGWSAMADLPKSEAIEYVHIRFGDGRGEALARAGAREGCICGRGAGFE